MCPIAERLDLPTGHGPRKLDWSVLRRTLPARRTGEPGDRLVLAGPQARAGLVAPRWGGCSWGLRAPSQQGPVAASQDCGGEAEATRKQWGAGRGWQPRHRTLWRSGMLAPCSKLRAPSLPPPRGCEADMTLLCVAPASPVHTQHPQAPTSHWPFRDTLRGGCLLGAIPHPGHLPWYPRPQGPASTAPPASAFVHCLGGCKYQNKINGRRRARAWEASPVPRAAE